VDTVAYVAIAATALTGGVGAVSSLFNVRSDFRAEHDLATLLAEPAHSSSMICLRQARTELAKASPDDAKLEDAVEVVKTLASELSRPKKRAVLAHLKQSSQESVAAYVVTLTEEAEHRISAREAGASAGN
jgi:hypothetical protein